MLKKHGRIVETPAEVWPHGRLRLKGGAVLITFLIAPDVSGVDW